ncbi:MAG: CYTH domain-containing protein [Cyanobacteria bacterium]|nr:CYTH domain-containing protein [Cyanobacteriota bacterium]
MALEIERRFLVQAEGWRSHVSWQARLQQGYLVQGAAGLTLRVRASESLSGEGSQAWLTLKAAPPRPGPGPGAGPAAEQPLRPGQALSRLEFEYAIPTEDAQVLLALAPHQLRKCRYGLDLAGGDWVLDVFEGDNAPLVVAEVELEDPEQTVVLPPWCGLELTGRHDLSNAALAARPLAQWSEAERQALLAG